MKSLILIQAMLLGAAFALTTRHSSLPTKLRRHKRQSPVPSPYQMNIFGHDAMEPIFEPLLPMEPYKPIFDTPSTKHLHRKRRAEVDRILSLFGGSLYPSRPRLGHPRPGKWSPMHPRPHLGSTNHFRSHPHKQHHKPHGPHKHHGSIKHHSAPHHGQFDEHHHHHFEEHHGGGDIHGDVHHISVGGDDHLGGGDHILYDDHSLNDIHDYPEHDYIVEYEDGIGGGHHDDDFKFKPSPPDIKETHHHDLHEPDFHHHMDEHHKIHHDDHKPHHDDHGFHHDDHKIHHDDHKMHHDDHGFHHDDHNIHHDDDKHHHDDDKHHHNDHIFLHDLKIHHDDHGFHHDDDHNIHHDEHDFHKDDHKTHHDDHGFMEHEDHKIHSFHNQQHGHPHEDDHLSHDPGYLKGITKNSIYRDDVPYKEIVNENDKIHPGLEPGGVKGLDPELISFISDKSRPYVMGIL